VRAIIANGMNTSGPVNWNYSIALGSGGNIDNQPIILNSAPSITGLLSYMGQHSGAALTRTFMKKKQAQIKLSGYDILNQNEGLFRYTTMNYIFDSQSLVQKRYFMMTLIYFFKKF